MTFIIRIIFSLLGKGDPLFKLIPVSLLKISFWEEMTLEGLSSISTVDLLFKSHRKISENRDLKTSLII